MRVVDPQTGVRVSLGTFPSKADADHAFASALHAQRTGTWAAPNRTALTLTEFATGWIETRLTSTGESLRPRTVELYEGLLRLHIEPTLGSKRLERLTTPMIRAWYTALRAQGGPGPSTAAKSYRLLRAILNTAVEDRVIAYNPCTIKGAGIERSDERPVPTVAQVFALADAIEPRFRALVLLAALGGLRRGELLALRRRDVDLLHRTVTVELQRQQGKHGEDLVGPPKTAAGRRTLVISREVIAVLEAHLESYAAPGPDGLVFTGVHGGFLRPHVLQKHWAKARTKVGLGQLHFHDLRHLAATLAAATGAGTKELMYRLGHISPQAALRYQHATTDRDGVIADAIDELIRASRTVPKAAVRELKVSGGHPRRSNR